jgi:hypothetical protein
LVEGCPARRAEEIRVRKTGLVLIIAAMALVFASGVAMAVTITGGPGDDTLRGTPDPDHLFGGAGQR